MPSRKQSADKPDFPCSSEPLAINTHRELGGIGIGSQLLSVLDRMKKSSGSIPFGFNVGSLTHVDVDLDLDLDVDLDGFSSQQFGCLRKCVENSNVQDQV